MKVVFIGSTKFSLECLNSIFEIDEIEIVGIVTNYQKFRISYSEELVDNINHSDLSFFSEEKGIDLYKMKDNMREKDLFDKLEEWNPEIILVVGWYHMIPDSIIEEIPTYGLHASLLPKYSGGAPLVWSIINGEEKTGITLFKFDSGVDTGQILDFREEEIRFEDTILDLYNRIVERGLNLLVENLPKIASGQVSYSEQNDEERTIFPQRSPEDGLIDWNMDSLQVYNFVRAQTHPYPGAYTFFGKAKVYLWSVKPRSNTGISASIGEIVSKSNKIFVGCGRNEIVEIIGNQTSEIETLERLLCSDGNRLFNNTIKEDASNLLERGCYD